MRYNIFFNAYLPNLQTSSVVSKILIILVMVAWLNTFHLKGAFINWLVTWYTPQGTIQPPPTAPKNRLNVIFYSSNAPHCLFSLPPLVKLSPGQISCWRMYKNGTAQRTQRFTVGRPWPQWVENFNGKHSYFRARATTSFSLIKHFRRRTHHFAQRPT